MFSLIKPLADSYVGGHYRDVYILDDGKPYEHPGVDLLRNSPAVTLGSPVIAGAAGKATVHAVDSASRPLDGWGDGTLGNCVVLDHPDTPFWTVVAHLSDFTIANGATVTQGQLVGHVGMTGKTTGPHVHWGMEEGGGGGFAPERYTDAQGVSRIGSTRLRDPLAYVNVTVEDPVTDALIVAQAAMKAAQRSMDEVVSLNSAFMLRGRLISLAYEPDLDKIIQATDLLRKAGFNT